MKEMDSITLTCIAAEKSGMSYGKYVAMFGCAHKGEEKKPIPSIHSKVCPECGSTLEFTCDSKMNVLFSSPAVSLPCLV